MDRIPEAARDIIDLLGLGPHPEGGYYSETYRARETRDGRAASTAIYFLITSHEFSAFHRIDADEVFHFYGGDPVEVVTLDRSGDLERRALGADISSGHRPQLVVPAGIWQGLRLVPGGTYALLGTTVAPGFAFEAFEMAERQRLIDAYPEHVETICLLTRSS